MCNLSIQIPEEILLSMNETAQGMAAYTKNFGRHHQNVWVKLWAMLPDIPTAIEHQYLNIGA